jgi:Leucine-rich repeat (LRR) protein
MNRLIAFILMVLVCLAIAPSSLAQTYDYYVNHVAEENWTTSITVFNTGPVATTFDLHRWDSGGTETVMTGLSVPAYSALTLTNADFGYNGTAKVTAAYDAPLAVRLSYRYRDSHSLCEFFLSPSFVNTDWMLPNPYEGHFDWFGLALANFNAGDATVTLTAYRESAVVATEELTIPAGKKVVDISSGIWDGVTYPDVDLVMIESDLTIPPPISITGNNEQDRHVFFPAQYEIQMCMGVPRNSVIPHVAEENWTTELTAYNNLSIDRSFNLSTWHEDGSPDVINLPVTVPAHGSAVLQAGTDFSYRTTGTIQTEACMHFKLSYRYGESQSLCQFFLHSGDGATRWVIPNSIQPWFDWFGLAFCNPTDQDIVVGLDAYKDGQYLGTTARIVEPHTKDVGIIGDFWEDLSKTKEDPATYLDIDLIILSSDYPLANPLSITGNSEQDRHVFSLAAPAGADSDFKDPAFRAFVLDNYDTNHDGEISQSEADAVTYMDTPGTYSTRGEIRNLEGIQIFRNLTELDCSYEKLTWLPDLSPLTHLQALYAESNYLIHIANLSALSSLNMLLLSNNQLTEIPPLTGLSNLTNLYLDQNLLNELPDMSGLTNLQSLNVSGNNLSGLPDLSDSTNLRNLSFGSNVIHEFPDLDFATELRLLDCSNNDSLETMDLSPFAEKLETLYCGYNQLTEIVDLSAMDHLKTLDCSHNRITDLYAVSDLTSLNYLACRANELLALPDLSPLTDLDYLICSENNLTEIPGLDSLDGLVSLYCEKNSITDLSAIADMSELTYLQCSECPLGALPDLSNLDNLQMLTCSDCELTDIPDVTGCDAIWYLWCDGNDFGIDDCPLIQTIEAMGLSSFGYNPQSDGSTLNCTE